MINWNGKWRKQWMNFVVFFLSLLNRFLGWWIFEKLYCVTIVESNENKTKNIHWESQCSQWHNQNSSESLDIPIIIIIIIIIIVYTSPRCFWLNFGFLAIRVNTVLDIPTYLFGNAKTLSRYQTSWHVVVFGSSL